MDNKLLLITATTLLYRESQLPSLSENSATLVRTLIESVALPEITVGMIDSEREILIALKSICLEMCEHPHTHQYEAVELLQKIRHAVRDEDSLYNSFYDGIQGELSLEALKRLCINLRKTITNHQREKKVNEILSKASSTLKFKRDTIMDINDFIAEVSAELEPYLKADKGDDPSVVGDVDFSDLASVEAVLAQARELNDDKGIMKTGWQGLNDATQGGLRRGEFVLVSALQHNFKTGFTLSIFKHIALYNTPYMLDPRKKPLLLRITFEDPLSLNVPFLYRNIYENKTLKQADLTGVSDADMARYIYDELTVNGYEIKMRQVNPTGWTYRDIFNYVEELEAQGYELHLLMLDYLNMIPKTGCDNTGPTGSNIRDLVRRVRNYCSAKKITLVTPHQMSTEAKQLVRDGLEDTFVKEVANKGYYDGCKTIDQEVDLELYFHIVKEDGKSWLCVQRGKHRLIKQTPESLKYFVLPFEDIGDIRDDIGKPATTRKKPGGPPIHAGGEKRAFFDFSKEDEESMV